MKKEGKVQNRTGMSALKGSSLWGILIFFALIAIDQITKALADVYFNMEGVERVMTVIPDWVYLTITYNRGISYGMGSNASPAVKLAVVAATGIMMLAVAIAYFKIDKRRSLMRLACVFIVAGGVGNLIDRLYYRVWDPTTAAVIRDGVRDMVDISSIGFAVCNFADFFISAGAVMLVLASLFFDSYAYSPKGKYKALQAEVEEKEKAKEEAKKAKKLAKSKAKELASDSDCAASVAIIGAPDLVADDKKEEADKTDEA